MVGWFWGRWVSLSFTSNTFYLFYLFPSTELQNFVKRWRETVHGHFDRQKAERRRQIVFVRHWEKISDFHRVTKGVENQNRWRQEKGPQYRESEKKKHLRPSGNTESSATLQNAEQIIFRQFPWRGAKCYPLHKSLNYVTIIHFQ